MKTNAPKKIYIACDVLTEEGRAFILEKPVSYLKSVEYTRTDAFIEKAWVWLELNLSDKSKEDIEFWLKDFRQYMEGE